MSTTASISSDPVGPILPPELWSLTAMHDSLYSAMSQTGGELEKLPPFLRAGYEAQLQQPILRVQNQEISTTVLALLHAKMPHLRAIDLTGSSVDGRFVILKNKIRKLFPGHLDLQIITSSFDQCIKQDLPHIVRKAGEEKQEDNDKRLDVLKDLAEYFAMPLRRLSVCVRIRCAFQGVLPADVQARKDKRIEYLKDIVDVCQDSLHHMSVSAALQIELQRRSYEPFDHLLNTARVAARIFEQTEKAFEPLVVLMDHASSPVEKEAAKVFFDNLGDAYRELVTLQRGGSRHRSYVDGVLRDCERAVDDAEFRQDYSAEWTHVASKTAIDTVTKGALTQAQADRMQAISKDGFNSPGMSLLLQEYGWTPDRAVSVVQ